MKVQALSLPGLLLLEPEVYRDSRGFFVESYSRSRYAEQGIDVEFVQDNRSHSRRDVLRGIHLQTGPNAQSKLVYCALGDILDVAVDLRPDSQSFGRYHAEKLTVDNFRRLLHSGGVRPRVPDLVG